MLSYVECDKVMRFWLVSPYGCKFEEDLLWNSDLCFSINIEGEVIWWENWYMVIRCDDVWNDGWWKSIQNNKGRIINQNHKGFYSDSILCGNIRRREEIPEQLSPERSLEEVKY